MAAAWRAAGFGVGSSIYKPGISPADVRVKAKALIAALAAAENK